MHCMSCVSCMSWVSCWNCVSIMSCIYCVSCVICFSCVSCMSCIDTVWATWSDSCGVDEWNLKNRVLRTSSGAPCPWLQELLAELTSPFCRVSFRKCEISVTIFESFYIKFNLNHIDIESLPNITCGLLYHILNVFWTFPLFSSFSETVHFKAEVQAQYHGSNLYS